MAHYITSQKPVNAAKRSIKHACAVTSFNIIMSKKPNQLVDTHTNTAQLLLP